MVPPGGYAWWYVDGLSDDGTQALSVIGFLGSVFSPWYRWSGRRDPLDHVCLNVATYGRGGGHFTMTDRGRPALRQSADTLDLGPSRMRWQGDALVIDIDEISGLPRIGRLRGRVVVTPAAITGVELALGAGHVWRPFAPVARIGVDLGRGLRWQGHGYFDANFGPRALESDFRHWTWGRYPHAGGATCFYDAERADGSLLAEALHVSARGEVSRPALPPLQPLPRSRWAVRRQTRGDAGSAPRQVLSMLDAPFYTRAVVETRLDGELTRGVHEALDLRRFRSPWLMPMLAFRVPRRRGWPRD